MTATKTGLQTTTLTKVVDYVRENYNKDIALKDMSSIAFLSSYHFSRLFKQSTGYTPHQFVLRCRINKAVELMGNSDLSLKEIAREVGFCDQSHLTRHFKRILGVSPACYCKNNGKSVYATAARTGS